MKEIILIIEITIVIAISLKIGYTLGINTIKEDKKEIAREPIFKKKHQIEENKEQEDLFKAINNIENYTGSNKNQEVIK